MKVALFTMYKGLSSTYSLAIVVAEHLRMLLDANIWVKLLVSEDCPETDKYGIFSGERIEWVKITNQCEDNQIKLYDYSSSSEQIHDTFFQEVDVISESIRDNLIDVDVCIMYDIHCQGWYLVHNVAIRKAQESLPNIRFIAYTHSEPVNRPSKIVWPFSVRYTPMPNTIYVYPNNSGIAALAKQYAIPEGRCRVVNNSLDILVHVSEDVKVISNKIDLLSPDILMIYPARLTTGKKFEKVATFASAIKNKTGKSVKVVFCDFPSSDINPDLYKALIRRLGRALNLNDGDLIFTSDLGFKMGFPRSGVLDLFTLSNLFVCPSFSESFGLIALEAASRGNFLVLNEKVPALEELGKQLHTYFMKWDARNFGYDTKETYHPSEHDYLEEHADKLVKLMSENPVVYAKTLVRQSYSRKWVWENQLGPLMVN